MSSEGDGLDNLVNVEYTSLGRRVLNSAYQQFADVGKSYLSVLLYPEKPFFALGNIVKNAYEIPMDIYHYVRNENIDDTVEESSKRVSRSLALAEVIAYFGANRGAHFFGYVIENGAMQAVVGGVCWK